MTRILKTLSGTLIPYIVLSLAYLTPYSAISAMKPEAASERNITFLAFSDIHLDYNRGTKMPINPPGPIGGYGVDRTTLINMLNKIKNVFRQPTFIIITGDIAGYDPTCTYQDEVFVFQHLNSVYGVKIPKILIFGNTDSLQTPYGPFYYPAGTSGVHSTYELAMQNGWLDGFLSTGVHYNPAHPVYPCIIDEDTTIGNFSLYLADKLRLIAFNSVVFSADSNNTASKATGQAVLNWITTELRNAAANNEQILLATHIPCGNDISILYEDAPFWRSQYQEQNTFYTLLSRYKNNIIGILCGHTHQDELKVLQNASLQNVGVFLITPGFITKNGNAPGVRTYKLTGKGSNWAVSDYTTYNFTGSTTPNINFNKLYDFDTYYGIKPGRDIIDYLSRVTISKMNSYYTAGNPHYSEKIAYPYDVLITLP